MVGQSTGAVRIEAVARCWIFGGADCAGCCFFLTGLDPTLGPWPFSVCRTMECSSDLSMACVGSVIVSMVMLIIHAYIHRPLACQLKMLRGKQLRSHHPHGQQSASFQPKQSITPSRRNFLYLGRFPAKKISPIYIHAFTSLRE